MQLCEAMRDTPSWRCFRHDGLPDDGLQPALDRAPMTSSGGNGYAHEYDLERHFSVDPLTVVGQTPARPGRP